MIILDEVAYADKVLKENCWVGTNRIKKCVLAAKKMIMDGKTDEEIIDVMASKFPDRDMNYNSTLREKKLKSILAQAHINPNLRTADIEFSGGELLAVNSFDNVHAQRAFFIILCITKFYNYKPVYFSISEVFKLAKTKTNGTLRNASIREIIRSGYYTLEERKITGRNARKVFFVPTEKLIELQGEPVLKITNLSNPFRQYYDWVTENVKKERLKEEDPDEDVDFVPGIQSVWRGSGSPPKIR